MNTTLDTVQPTLASTQVENALTLKGSMQETVAGTCDPYTVKDCHWVGNDGFIVPANFAEFYERFPRYVSNWVARFMPAAQYSLPEREDRVSDLLLHLMDLPEESMYRQPGTLNRPDGSTDGCTDRVQVFHPEKFYGASAARFYSYINLILRNHFISLFKKAGANPILRTNFISLYAVDTDTKDQVIDEQYLSRISTIFRDTVEIGAAQLEQSVMVEEFLTFVEEYNPELISVLNAIGACGSYTEAQAQLDMTEQIFMRSRNRLKVLYNCFADGMTPPRQRKIYRPRAAKVAAAQARAVEAHGAGRVAQA